MCSHRHILIGIAALTMPFCFNAAGVDFHSFKTDNEADQWLGKSSGTYAMIVKEIKARKDIRGYRFATKDVPRGMVAWVDGWLEIQLNPKLSGPARISTLIFEMTNASRNKDHGEIDLAVDKGLIATQEEFGLGHEILEFEAMRLHRQVLIEIQPRAGALPKDFFFLVTPTPRSAQDYQLPGLYQYLKTQKESGHTAHYYKHFHLRKAALQPPK